MVTEYAVRSDIAWTDAGWQQYQKMKTDVGSIHAHYGIAAANHVAMSLYICMERLFSCGPCNVQKDGDSLYVTTHHIVFGVNWHRINDVEFKDLVGYDRTEFPDDFPAIGTWSLNS